MAITFLPPKPNLGTMLGEAAGSGLRSGIEQGSSAEFNMRQNERTQQRQASRLQQALSGLDPNSPNFIESFKQIAPALVTTPGGPQLLAEISPILSTLARNNALNNSLGNPNNRSAGNNQGNVNQPNGEPSQQTAQISNNPYQNSQDKYLRPEAPQAENTNFPQRAANFGIQPEMSAADKQDLTRQIVKDAAANGTPMEWSKAMEFAENQANQITQQNNRIYEQQQQQETALERDNDRYVAEAKNHGFLKHPEDETLVRKFANEARNAAPGQDAWEYIRTQMNAFDTARTGLERNYILPGAIDKQYRKLTGTFKEKQQAINDMQTDLDFFREHGLYSQARDILTNTVGFGPEDTELALFPFDKYQEAEINQFPKNSFGPKKKEIYGNYIEQRENTFPGEKYNLPNDKFLDFKKEIADILHGNDNINLIGLRGRLNQDKGSSWPDIYKAIDQLREEERFKPNIEQQNQLRILQNAPIPGLGEFFQYMLQGRK